jgi:sugar phosphate isomerase/epimerase
VTLLRTIERLGEDHLGVNLDTANLILYGKANPLDALDVFGRYVRDTHIKDGFYPTDGDNLGRQVPVGEGKVDFPAVIARLKELGYTGPLTIEREIRGAEQDRDIRAAVEYLRPLC